MEIKIPISFVNQFEEIIYKQNDFLLKEICEFKKWDYPKLRTIFLNDKKINLRNNIKLSNETEINENISIRSEWIYQNTTYYLEKDTNNVFDLNNSFIGKNINGVLDIDYEET